MTLIINIVIGVLYFSFYFSAVLFSESYIDKLIKNSTIIKIEAKKYMFYWLIYLLLIISCAFVVFLMNDDDIKIKWIEQYVKINPNNYFI
jgi:mannose/fructose/N-acetylgalactosamine-specific phosphotransferase system component IIC